MSLQLNEVHNGDCVELLGKVDEGSVDLVFADPPFNIGYEYDIYNDSQSKREYLDWSRKWMEGVYTALKPSGTFWLAIGDEYAAELKVLAQDIGFTSRSWVIWYYTFGVNCVRGFSRSHTHLFHFVKDPNQFTFNSDNPAVRVPSARQLVYADGRANPKGRLPDNTWIYRPQDAPGAFVPGHDTWYFPRIAGTFKERQGFHGCQMPEQLLGRIVRVSSNPRDLVMDPFSGSGTTVRVAKKLGRRYLGFELSPNYASAVKERLAEVQIGDKLEGPEDPSKSAPSTKAGKRKLKVRQGRPMPEIDEDTTRGIIAAYLAASGGVSTDYLLCDADLNAKFAAECKKLGLRGDAFVWNRFLLRLRKSKQFPKATKIGKRFSFVQMEKWSFASEIAMRLMELDYELKLDDILCSPPTAAEFDKIASEFAHGFSSFEYRWAALAIRKRATKAKQLAISEFSDWAAGEKKLPAAMRLSEIDFESLAGQGVYLLNAKSQLLYVGESTNVKERIEQVQSSKCWTDLGLESVSFYRTKKDLHHGLQSALVSRLRPMLNTRILAA